jgi:hypothetical protein
MSEDALFDQRLAEMVVAERPNMGIRLPRGFQSKFGVGDPVDWNGLPATVRAVEFSSQGVRYTLDFDSGGAPGAVWSNEVRERPDAKTDLRRG